MVGFECVFKIANTPRGARANLLEAKMWNQMKDKPISNYFVPD